MNIMEEIMQKLKQHNTKFDVISDTALRVYPDENSHDYTALRITENNLIEMFGRIIDFDKWISN
jgi:(p)ppGpp synthase/HD superfamily hydrolase